jgi:glycosyltransferase involved in cell wall biosynthesis
LSALSRVLLVSRSLTPPWDEASKNFARVLALRSRSSVAILNDAPSDAFPTRVEQIHLYSRPELGWRQRARLLRLRRRRGDFDVIHYLFTPTFLNSVLFRTVLGGGRARTVQTVASLNGRQYTSAQAKRVMFADRIVTYSDFSRDRLVALGVPEVRTIQPGIDLATFSPAPADAAVRAAYGIEPDEFVVMYPGEYVRLGATDSLVAVLPELVAAIPRLRLVFGCRIKNQADAQKKAEVIEAIAARGLSEHVAFTDTVIDMPSLYNMADVVLFPVENMTGKFDVPLAVVEAMACAKPIVISDLTVLAEFTDDDTALVVPLGDRAALVEQVRRLHVDASLRAKHGAAARAYAERWFDIETVAERYDEIYDELTEATR